MTEFEKEAFNILMKWVRFMNANPTSAKATAYNFYGAPNIAGTLTQQDVDDVPALAERGITVAQITLLAYKVNSIAALFTDDVMSALAVLSSVQDLS